MSKERKAYEDGFLAGYKKGRADEKLEAAEASINLVDDSVWFGDHPAWGSLDPEVVLEVFPKELADQVTEFEHATYFVDAQDAMNSLYESVKDSDNTLVSTRFFDENTVLGPEIDTNFNHITERYSFWIRENPEKVYSCQEEIYERMFENRTYDEVRDLIRARIAEQ